LAGLVPATVVFEYAESRECSGPRWRVITPEQ
jgi:hypothetical protein